MEFLLSTGELQNCGILYISLTLDLKIVEVSPSLAKLFGRAASELVGKDSSEFLSSDGEQLNSVIEKLQNAPGQCLGFPFALNNKSFEVKTWLIQPQAESAPLLQCIFFETTTQKEMEQRLHDKNQLIDSMFQASLDAIIIADADGRILEWGVKLKKFLAGKHQRSSANSCMNTSSRNNIGRHT